MAGTYDGTTMKLYIDGKKETQASYSYSSTDGEITIGSRGAHSWHLEGKLDEIAIWGHALSEEELQTSMNLTYEGSEPGLLSYWQFNEGSGTSAGDPISNVDGTLNNMGDDDWIESTIALGGGTSDVQTVSTTGNVDFTGTGLSMDFTAKTGTDNIVVARIDTVPNINPTGVNTVFDDQYWVVNQFGSGTFEANLTFTISENLANAEETNPGLVKLYTRNSNDDGDWVYLISANSVDAANNKVTFNGINGFSQFIICSDILKFSGHISQDATWSGAVIVDGDIFVDNGTTLTIDPGTYVEFQGHYKLDVQGRLLAEGTATDSITFTPADHNTGWNRIIFDDTPATNDSSKIIYCRLEYGKGIGNFNNGGALFVGSFGDLLISRSTFYNNNSEVWGGAIYCDESDIRIENCDVNNNWGGFIGCGIYISDCNPFLTNNLIRNNNGGNGSVSCSNSDAIFINNTIVNNNNGLYCINNSDPTIKNTTVMTQIFIIVIFKEGTMLFKAPVQVQILQESI